MTRLDAPTVARVVEEPVEPTERLETVLFRDCRGPLGDLTEEWHEYTAVASLPDRPLAGRNCPSSLTGTSTGGGWLRLEPDPRPPGPTLLETAVC